MITALPDLYGRLVGKRIQARLLPRRDRRATACTSASICWRATWRWTRRRATPSRAGPRATATCARVPDPASLRRAAWLDRSAIVICDALEEESDAPIEVAPRSILKRQLERAAPSAASRPRWEASSSSSCSATTTARRAPRATAGSSTPGGYVEDYHLLSGTFAEPVLGEIRRRVDASAIPVEFSKGEWGPGQHELNLRYAPALEMADRHVIYKQAAKEIAAAQGASLTFMAKFDEKLAGSSLHIHTSLWSAEGEPLFGEKGETLPGTPVHAPPLFRWFLAGLLAHARELGWFFAPYPNSYKRYRAGTFAPTGIAWSYDNRTAGFRIVGEGASLRVECRIPGADANPYLAYAARSGRRPRRDRAQARPGSRLRGRRLRREAPAPRAAHASRGARRAREERLRPPRLRRRRDRPPAPLRAHRAGGLRYTGQRRRARALLRADLSVRGAR